MNCRHCNSELGTVFLDLGTAPPSNAYLDRDAFKTPELWYPLKLLVCDECWLVQTEDHAEREQLFTDDYAYFSSISTTLTTHAERFVCDAISRFNISPTDTVVEIAANDGYLLQYFQQRGIPCYGIEPTRSTANAARSKGLTPHNTLRPEFTTIR